MSSRVNAIIPAGAGLTPSSRSTPFAECWSTQTSGCEHAREDVDRHRERDRERSARCSATAFGTSSPSDDAEVREDERTRSAKATPRGRKSK